MLLPSSCRCAKGGRGGAVICVIASVFCRRAYSWRPPLVLPCARRCCRLESPSFIPPAGAENYSCLAGSECPFRGAAWVYGTLKTWSWSWRAAGNFTCGLRGASAYQDPDPTSPKKCYSYHRIDQVNYAFLMPGLFRSYALQESYEAAAASSPALARHWTNGGTGYVSFIAQEHWQSRLPVVNFCEAPLLAQGQLAFAGDRSWRE